MATKKKPAKAKDTQSRNFQRILFNLKPKSVRNETMSGKDYLVVPMVMLTEGVHEGSAGAYYYPESELAKRPQVWNHKPVVVYHPDEPSACDPTILNTRGIGLIMNTKWDGRLTAEAWLEKDRIEKVDNRIAEAIEAGTMLELSTGLFADSDETPGEWDDKEYSGTLHNYGPDHLAILPDQIGACSIEDGAGFFRNMSGSQVSVPRSWMKYFNELSANEIRDRLQDLVWVDGSYTYVVDVYDNYFIYDQGDSLYRQDYILEGEEIQLTNVPQQVERVVTYDVILTMKGTDKMAKNKEDQKKKLVQGLIDNASTLWAESDKEYLNGLDEETLEKMEPIVNEEPPKEEPKEIPVVEKKETPVANTEPAIPKPKTMDEYLKDMPADIRNTLTDSLARDKEEKAKLIAKITANERNPFNEEFLEQKDLKELRGLVVLSSEPVAADSNTVPMFNFSGQGDPVTNTADENVPSLDVPTLNFEKKTG